MPLYKRHLITLIVLSGIFFSTHVFPEVHFEELSGTDLGMGTGARAIGLGGAFTAVADDVSATFWNPAGLSTLKSNEAHLSCYFPNEFSAASFAVKPPMDIFYKINFTFGISLVNRLRLKGDSGPEGTWDGYPSQILDLSMIEVGEEFSGKLDSKTMDTRLSVSLKIKKLSLGASTVFIR